MGRGLSTALVLALGLMAGSEHAGAHHSIAGVYDSSKPVTVRGMVRAFHFVNPHPWVELDVVDDARSQRWRLELDNRFELVAIGMTDATLTPGDEVVVSGSASRETARALYVRSLLRSVDGLHYEQVGQSPRLTRPRR